MSVDSEGIALVTDLRLFDRAKSGKAGPLLTHQYVNLKMLAEEGLALIDEKAARLLAEKSIIVTRAFLEERERRFGRKEAGKESGESAKDQNESGGNEDKD